MGNNKTKHILKDDKSSSVIYTTNELQPPLYNETITEDKTPPSYNSESLNNIYPTENDIINDYIDIYMSNSNINDTIENKLKYISENIKINIFFDKIKDFTYLIEKLSDIHYDQLDNINTIIENGYKINYNSVIFRRLCISKYVNEDKLIEFFTKNNFIKTLAENKNPFEHLEITFIELCIIGNKYKLAKILFNNGLIPLYKQSGESTLRTTSYIENNLYVDVNLKRCICLSDLNQNDKTELYNYLILSKKQTIV